MLMLVPGIKALHTDRAGGRTGVEVVRLVADGTAAVVRGVGVTWTCPVAELEPLEPVVAVRIATTSDTRERLVVERVSYDYARVYCRGGRVVPLGSVVIAEQYVTVEAARRLLAESL